MTKSIMKKAALLIVFTICFPLSGEGKVKEFWSSTKQGFKEAGSSISEEFKKEKNEASQKIKKDLNEGKTTRKNKKLQGSWIFKNKKCSTEITFEENGDMEICRTGEKKIVWKGTYTLDESVIKFKPENGEAEKSSGIGSKIWTINYEIADKKIIIISGQIPKDSCGHDFSQDTLFKKNK